jgi:hypothetical protein
MNSLLAVGLVVLIGGLIGFWYLSRVTPKGTILVIAAVIYFASWMIDPGTNRNLNGLVGILRMLGLPAEYLGSSTC